MKKPKTIRDQIMLLPDPLNHLVIELFSSSSAKDRLKNDAIKCRYLRLTNTHTTPIGEFLWRHEDSDMLCAIAEDGVFHKLWEVEP